MIIRRIETADLVAVCRIEYQAMDGSWSQAQMEAEVHAANGYGLVADIEGEVRGFAFFRTCKPEAELLRLVVDPGCRRGGIGSALLNAGVDQLAAAGFNDCYLEVRGLNLPAIHLYQQVGFMPIGRRMNYYRDPVDDAIQMRLQFLKSKGEQHENVERA